MNLSKRLKALFAFLANAEPDSTFINTAALKFPKINRVFAAALGNSVSNTVISARFKRLINMDDPTDSGSDDEGIPANLIN